MELIHMSNFTAAIASLAAHTTSSEVIDLLPRYACDALIDRMTVVKNGYYAGRLALSIPSAMFYNTRNEGKFLLQLSFPIVKDGNLMVKVGLFYVNDNGKAVSLGGETAGAKTNINSSYVNIAALRDAGYFADDAIDSVMKWAVNNVDGNKPYSLVPTEDVVFVLRHSVYVGDDVSRSKNTPCNIVIDAFDFVASCLPANGGLMRTVKGGNASFAELANQYGGRSIAELTVVSAPKVRAVNVNANASPF
jgi:hypothetical protein